MSNKIISIIIPVYNGGRTIGRCLESVFESDNTHFECIVVDDASTDNTLEIVEKYDVSLIKLNKKQGAAHARNIGADNAQGDILFFIDADVTLYPDCIDKVLENFKANPDISALFGSYDQYPDGSNLYSQYKNLFHRYIHQTSKRDATTFWTACGAVYKHAFIKVGKFDQECRMMEDIELGYRLKLHEYKILLVKDLIVKHLKYYTFTSLIKSDFLDRAIPWTVLLLKNNHVKSDLNIKASHKISALVVLFLAIVLLISVVSIEFVFSVPLLLLLFFLLNYDFYHYFYKLKGVVFTLKIVPLHILYYCYSSLGYIIGMLKYRFSES